MRFDELGSLMERQGFKPRKQAEPIGLLEGFKRGFVGNAAGTLGGQLDFAEANLGIGGELGDSLNDVAQENARSKDYTLGEMIPFASDYYTNGEGLAYDIGSPMGSMAVLGGETAAASVAAGAAGIGTLGGLATGLAGRATAAGLPRLGAALSSKYGPLIVGKVATTIPELPAEGGTMYRQGIERGLSPDDALDRAWTGVALEAPFLSLSNLAEGSGLGALAGGLKGRGGKKIARDMITAAVAGAGQQAGEEGTQQQIANYVTGARPDLDSALSVYNPLNWKEDEQSAARAALPFGALAGGVGTAAGRYFNKTEPNVIERKVAEEQPEIDLRPAPIAEDIEDFDLSKTDANLVSGVNGLNSWAYDNFGKDLIISGGYRNAEHNAAVNGSPTSYHLYGQALDVDASNFTEAERKQIEAKAREMGFNSNGEDMYHDKGSGLHFHLILPDSNLASPFTTKGVPEAVDFESNSIYDELPAEVAARNAAEVEKQLDRISRGRGFVVDDISELSKQQRMEDAAAQKELALSPVDAYLAEQERIRNEAMAERWDEAAGRNGFMPQSYYDNPVDFYLNQRFIETIEKAKRNNGKKTDAANIEVPKKYLNSDAVVRGLRGLERDTAEGIRQMYPDALDKGWKQEQQRVQKRYDEMLEPALKELRSGMKQGVEVIRPDGEGRGYRASRNAPWYSDFYKQYKRPPTQTELRELAYEAMTGQRNILQGFENNSAESAEYFAEQKRMLDEMRSQLAAFEAIKGRMTDNNAESAGVQLVTPGAYVKALERANADLAGIKTTPRREKLAERAVNNSVAISAAEGMLDGDTEATETFNSYIPEVRSALLNKIGEERGYDGKTDERQEDQLQDDEFKQGEEDKGETGAQDENAEAVNKKTAITKQEFKQQEENTSLIDNEGVKDNVTDGTEKLATGDGEVIASENEVRENAGSREPAGGNGQGVRETESGGSEGHLRADSIHDGRTSASRKSDDRGVQRAESDDTTDSAGSAGLSGSVVDSFAGQSDVNGEATGRAVKLAENGRVDAADKRRELNDNSKNLKAESLRRVAKDLPFLTVGQVEDVVFAEQRLKDEKKTGVLFTNGTGTGKTFSGLGIAKELDEHGKNNILIVTPNDQINAQWISAAKDYFDLMITPLDGIKDAGKGATITTYANMQQNDAIVKRDWDLVIADESQNLMNNEKGEATGALQKLRAITFNKRGLYERAKVLLRTDEEKRLDKELDDVNRELRKDKDNAELDAKREMLQSKLHELSQEHAESDRKAIEEWQKIPDSEKPKVVFLSATPFAYDKDVDYAEGYLFNYPESDGSGYNSGDGREQFMMQHFGYRMRNNKLTRPDAQVDNRVMEVQFHEWLRKEGALSGRQLDIDKDYNRGFLLVGQGVGKNIDEGFNWLNDHRSKYGLLSELLRKRFNSRTRNYMIESIKAREVIPIVREYLELGKKVVLFHDTKKPRELEHPFKLSQQDFMGADTDLRAQLKREYEQFAAERADLIGLNVSSLKSPMEILQGAFGDELMLFNGDVPKTKRREYVREFNDDAGKKRLILVQADAGNAGISLHDTTGKHQRVLINLGIPKRPSYAIQIEGRIYRQGSMSNAIIRYLSTGMNVEKQLFAGTIASRASTAENLALGNQARGLRDSFINAFLETMDGSWEQRKPGAAGEDVGGKEYDRSTLSPLSDFDRAKSLYFANQKKNARNKAAEGKDYFATPEPIGFKMVEWAGLNDGDRVLEPSAGHGAISRFFSPNTENVIIEPSGKLVALAQMNTDGAKVINSNFEDYNVINKFNAIVMNPPFGVGGKTAMEHVAKAFKHLRDNGRIIAIVPDGASMTKRFDRWYDSEEAANAYLVGEVLLPGETFQRAGTGVYTKILVIDKHMSKERDNVDSRQIDLRASKSVNELFDRIENLSMPERTGQVRSIKSVENKNPAVTATTPMQDNNLFETDTYTHTKTGEKLYRAKIKERVSGDDYKKLSQYAKNHGGYYSRFAKGFLFDEEGNRDSFIDYVNSDKGEELNPSKYSIKNKSKVLQTETPEFKRWFGQSKVVDENGEPLVVYHGSQSLEDIEIFDNGMDHPEFARAEEGFNNSYGIYFTPDEDVAKNYAVVDTYAAYLSMKKPLDLRTEEGANKAEEIIQELNSDNIPYKLTEDGVLSNLFTTNAESLLEEFEKYGIESRVLMNEIAAAAHKNGYDGIIFNDVIRGGIKSPSYVVFESNQIKSATDNVGTFDADNPDIRYGIKNDNNEELNPIALDEWEVQAKDAFPNAKNFNRDGSVMEFDLPNGQHMRIDVVERVVLDDAEFERVQADYGGRLERDADVLGSVRTIGKNAFMTLTQDNVRGTIDHEALHYARTHGLTGRENAALERAFKGNEEAMAEAYRKWRIRWKELKEGSDWGKLWRKVKDFAAKVADFLGFETEHDIFRKIESGEVWERDSNNGKTDSSYKVTNSQITGETRIPVVDVTGLPKVDVNSSSQKVAIARSLIGKTFRIIGSNGIGRVANMSDGRHLVNSSNNKLRTSSIRRQSLSAIEDILNNSIYIEKHIDGQHGTKKRYVELYAVVKDGNNLTRFRIVAKEGNGNSSEFEVKDAKFYDIIKDGTLAANMPKSILPANIPHNGMQRQVSGNVPSSTVSIAELLTGVKDRKGVPYVNKDGGLNYDAEALRGIKYSILSKKDEQKQAEPKDLTSGQKAARAFTNTERKGTVRSALDWMIDAKKNAYTNWIDKNDSLHGLDEAISMGLGRKLTDDESVYNKAQTMRANAAGLSSALIEGDAKSVEAVNERLKNKKLPHKVTLAMVLDTVNRKVMDKRYPDYLQRNDFKNWADALGTYLGCMRLREMSQIVKDAYAAELAEWRENGSKGRMPEFKPYKLPGHLSEADLQAVIDGAPAEFRRAADLYYKFNDNLLTVMEDAGLISAEVHKLLNTKYKYYAPLMRDFSDTAAADNFIGGLQGLGRGIANVSSTLKKISIEGSGRSVLNPLESTIKAVAVVASRAERNKVGRAAVALTGESGLDGAVWKVPGSSADAKNCIFTVMEDGRKVAYQTTPELYGPIVGYNETSAGVVFGLLRNSARLLRSGATMSPSFILRNLIRDTLFAGISSKTGFMPVLDTVRGIYALLRNPKLRAEFEAAGVNKFNFYGSNEAIAKSLDDLTGGKEFKDYSAGDIWRALLKYPALFSELAESGTRMGEFMRARKQGISIDEAARYARELTLDFSRSGVQGEKVNQIVPFFNACLQGGDKMIRLLKNDSVNTMTALGKYIVLPSILLWCLNHDEDWYKELDPNVKNSCWCLPGGIRIPKPQEAGIFFGSGVEMILDMASNEDPAAMENFRKSFLSNAAPNFLPTLFLPIIEWQANYSFFRNQPLIGKRLERLPDELQYNPGTSEAAKAIGSVTKWSPVKIDNTIRGYTGTMGMFFAQVFDPLVAEKRNMPSKKFGELTFIRDFTLNDNIKNRSVNDFYDMLAAANEQHAGYGVNGRPTAVVKNIRKAGELISKANKDIRNITMSTALSPDEKRARIDKRKEYIRNVAKRVNQLYGKYY